MSNYNGYSNRETWATVLQISNTKSLYDTNYGQPSDVLKMRFYQTAKQYNYRPDSIKEDWANALSDIGDLSKVNWDEVAEACQS